MILCYQSEIYTGIGSGDFVPGKNGRKKKIKKKEGDEGSIGFELPFSLASSFHSSLGRNQIYDAIAQTRVIFQFEKKTGDTISPYDAVLQKRRNTLHVSAAR